MQEPSIARRAVALAAGGQQAEAIALLNRGAEAGDGEALFARGLWRIEGRLLARDLAAARADIGRAADAGHGDATKVHAAFLASGIGGPRDWSGALASVGERERTLLDAMDLDENGEPRVLPDPEQLHATTDIRLFRALLTHDECDFLAELAAPRFRPALIFHESRKQFVRDPLRDSDASSFPIVSETPFVHALNRRIAAASGTSYEQGETLQILRYAPGQQYRPHFDAIPGMANQRIFTAIAWLTDGYEGGETAFPELGLAVRGDRGDLLLFANALPDGRPDPAMRHAGRPILSGTKLIASRWIRQRPPEDPLAGFGQHEAEAPAASV